MQGLVNISQWIDKASISAITMYVAYDAYDKGRTAIALVAAAFSSLASLQR